MDYTPFPVSNFRTGLDSEVKPWLLPVDAFQSILNGYIHDGVTYKRAGMQEFGELVHYETRVVDIVAGPGNIAILQLFAPGTLIAGTRVQLNGATGGSFGSLNGIEYTISIIIGPFVQLFAPDGTTLLMPGGVYTLNSATLSIFPELPVMGLRTFVNPGNERLLLAMDTRRVCLFDATINAFQPLDLADVFTGDNTNFFASATYGRTGAFSTPAIFFTNNLDNIRYYQSGLTTTALVPDANPTGAAVTIQTCRFMFSIKTRLLLLDTLENGTRFGQRMRWCRAGNPADTGSNWDQVVPGNGGFVDAPTSDNIISAKELQGIILVQFTNSYWTIKPTSDPALPFRWDKLNDFRASDSPYGGIGHDRYVITFGKRGIVACDAVEVTRIDDKIKNFVTDEINTTFFKQVYSERNYAARRSWTLYPSASTEATTSDYALVRTEEEGAWSIYKVQTLDRNGNPANMSCLGFGEVSQDLAFQDFDGRPGAPDQSFEQFANETFQSFFVEGQSEVFLGGDQVGRVLFLEKDGDDLGEPIDFELVSAGWNPFKEQGVSAQLGYVDFYLDADKNTQFTVEFFSGDISSPYETQTMNCLPNLGFIADIQNVALTNPVTITADSSGLTTGDEVYVYGINGTIEITDGPFTVTVVDENTVTLDGIDATGYTAYISGGQLVEREFDNVRCWKRAFAGGKGYQHFIRITNSGIDDQLVIHSYTPWFRQVSSRMIG